MPPLGQSLDRPIQDISYFLSRQFLDRIGQHILVHGGLLILVASLTKTRQQLVSAIADQKQQGSIPKQPARHLIDTGDAQQHFDTVGHNQQTHFDHLPSKLLALDPDQFKEAHLVQKQQKRFHKGPRGATDLGHVPVQQALHHGVLVPAQILAWLIRLGLALLTIPTPFLGSLLFLLNRLVRFVPSSFFCFTILMGIPPAWLVWIGFLANLTRGIPFMLNFTPALMVQF
jgi:hypothetical protein